MGNPSFNHYTYSVPLAGTATDDCTAIYRSAEFRDRLLTVEDSSVRNTWDILQKGTSYGPDCPYLGTRATLKSGELGPYVWKTYKEVETIVQNLGAGIVHYSLLDVISFNDVPFQKEFQFLGIFSKNREEWLFCDFACAAYGFTLVPLYDTLAKESIQFILNLTRLTAIAASAECILKLLNLEDSFEYLKHIIAFETSEKLVELAKKKNLNIYPLSDLIQKGKENPIDLKTLPPSSLDAVNTVCFTSGTTGEPKGAILTHRNFLVAISGCVKGPLSVAQGNISNADVILSYLPLAHVYERIIEVICTSVGARIGFYNGDILRIKEDIVELNPSIFASVPRLFYRMNDRIMAKIETKPRFLQKLFHHALKVKVANIRGGQAPSHWFYDLLIFNKIKTVMGNHARYLMSGSAPFSSELQDSFKAIFGLPFSQGYGLTESMGGSFVSHPNDPISGHIGGPVPCLEFKLLSIPDMNYNAHAAVPKGELLLRGGAITPGYFRNPKATEEMLDAEGWLHTGDVAQLEPNGAIKIIDRRKNIFKLSQGEYVIPEKVEGVLVQAAAIEQIFVFGNSMESCTVAIIVPSEDFAKLWCTQRSQPFSSLAELCTSSAFKERVKADMDGVAKHASLVGFEIPKAIHLEATPFSIENDILTPSFKLKRAVATRVYTTQLDALYASLKSKPAK